MTVIIADHANKRDNGIVAFEKCNNADDIVISLKNVLKNTGGLSKTERMLYHYSNIKSISNILNSGYLWLGSVDNMNDYLEKQYIRTSLSDKKIFLTSFTKYEENLAMYKMYCRNNSGAMLGLSYSLAEEIVNNLKSNVNNKCKLKIVHDKRLTNDEIEAELFWTAVCYKDLYTDKLTMGTVSNNNIRNPFSNSKLAGYIKLYGWSYEQEVRLCAVTEEKLNDNDCLAIPLPDNFNKSITITKAPDFDNQINSDSISYLRLRNITVKESEYASLARLN